ncbi:hypothetical protein BSK63_16890 [Paenibacillus odorifer]|uniref:Uncharacterized protein n=1 Tax=Paenibacillus odorifer TaxID=189426 RepID=A0A1R0X1T7_9BACL|nr:hypothetical protein BJP51_26420 [Paenibacillus odorifer]OME30571.1 hypothetical protein BSK63_16890 [Paenibacillus odorifer]OME32628.1 hypothetical protein BSK58_27975 [Paenibacillus odorifer]
MASRKRLIEKEYWVFAKYDGGDRFFSRGCPLAWRYVHIYVLNIKAQSIETRALPRLNNRLLTRMGTFNERFAGNRNIYVCEVCLW